MEKSFIHKFIKDTSLTIIGRAASVVLHFFSIMLLSRHLPPETFGLYFLVLAAVHILEVVAGLGLDLTLVRQVATADSKGRIHAFGQIVFLRVFAAVILGLVLFLGGGPVLAKIEPRLGAYCVLVAVIFVLGSLRNMLYHTLQGLRFFVPLVAIQTGSALLRLALIITLIFSGKVNIANILYIEVAVPGCVILAVICCLPFDRLSLRTKGRSPLADLFRFSTPIYLNNILTVVIERANVLMIGILLNLRGVAVYEVAGKIPGGFLQIFRAFIVVFFPNLSQLFGTHQKEDAQLLVNQSLGILSAGISILVFGVFLFRQEIIVLVFSGDYLDAALPLFLMMINFQLRAISNVMGYSIVSAGRSSVPVLANTISSILLVAGGILLIPRYGVIGGIVSLYFMNLSSQAVYVYFLHRSAIRIEVFEYIKPLLVVIAVCGVYFYIGWDGVVSRVVLAVCYAGFCWLTARYWRDLVGTVYGKSLQIIGVRS